MKRGRPENIIVESPTKFSREYTNNAYREDIITRWNYDLSKYDRGPMSVDVIYPKSYEFPKRPKINNSVYIKQPIVMIYKTSERANARYKLKIWRNKNIDQILSGKNNGVADDMIVLELGVGEGLIELYQNKYKQFL